MIQKPIRDYNGQQYSKAEGAELIKELNDRTKYNDEEFNSIQLVGEKLKIAINQIAGALLKGGFNGTAQDLYNEVMTSIVYAASINNIGVVLPGKNIADPNDFEPGILNGVGGLTANENFISTGYIPVVAGLNYTSIYKRYVSYFSENNEASFISTDFDYNTNGFSTAPVGANFARFDFFISDPAEYQVEQSNLSTNYEPYALSLNPALKANDLTENAISKANSPFYKTINDLANSLDATTDKDSPLFLNLGLLTKISGCPGNPIETAIQSRDNDHQFTVNPSLISSWNSSLKTFAIVLIVAGKYKVFSCYCEDKATGIIKVAETLPAVLTSFMLMQEGVAGQHLSRWGYRALAEFLAEITDRYSYKKDTLYDFSPSQLVADGGITAKDADGNIVANFIKTPGTLTGGIAFGEVPNLLQVRPFHSDDSGQSLYEKEYWLVQKGAGRGATLEIDNKFSDGYLEIIVGEHVIFNEAPLRLTVKDELDNVLYTNALRGCVQSIKIDTSTNTSKLKLSFTAETSSNFYWTISQIRLYKKRPTVVKYPLKKEGLNIAVFCDSWGEFPIAQGGEVGLNREDGSESPGLQFLSEHLKIYLTSEGFDVNTFNNSRGGQTSSWAKFYLKKQVLELPTKPDYCVINFAVNDSNSYDEFIAGGDSVYDFDPVNPNIQTNQSNGGIRGAVDEDLWYENMMDLIDTLLANNIKPIVMIPLKVSGIDYSRIDMYKRYLKLT